jgi:hypothetical protein
MIAPKLDQMHAGDKLVMTFHKNPKPAGPSFLGNMAGATGGASAAGAPGGAPMGGPITSMPMPGGFTTPPPSSPLFGGMDGNEPGGGVIAPGRIPLPGRVPVPGMIPAAAPAGQDPLVSALLAKPGIQ